MSETHTESLSFPGSQGYMLDARLEWPPGEPAAYALFAHCFTCSKDVLAAARISRALAARGIAVLRFDFTGLGGSGGEFANTNFSSNIADLICAADHLRERHRAPALLIGHSLGGAAVLAAAHRVPEAKAVAVIAAPSDPGHIVSHFAEAAAEIEARGEAEVEIAGRQFTIQKQLLDDLAAQQLEPAVAQLERALLVMHSPSDAIVDIQHAETILDWARQPKSFVSLDDADHLLARRADAEYVAEVLAAWASRYLPISNDHVSSVEPGTVMVSETGRYAQRIRVGRHVFYADEPSDYGGEDRGPTPHDLLLAGLGACTAITLRMYAERKKLPLNHVAVRLRHSRAHAEDCENCESENARIERIERAIELQGELDAEQRRRLLEIADKCPVHRTLKGPLEVVTSADKLS